MRMPDGTILMHMHAPYDASKAHEYYERTKHLKGRRVGTVQPVKGPPKPSAAVDPIARAKAKAHLTVRIQNLESRLESVKAQIKKMQAADKPKSASDKAEDARKAKKYRQSHKSELAAKAKKNSSKASTSGGSAGSAAGNANGGRTVADFQALATKLSGKIAVAKAKLSAL